MNQTEYDEAVRKIKETFYEYYSPKKLRENPMFCIEAYGYLNAIFLLFPANTELVKWSVNGMSIMLDLTMKDFEEGGEDF